MITINRTFDVITEESAANGEASESGFISEGESVGFRELVEMIRYGVVSCYPARGDTREWITLDCGETREYFETGARSSEAIHYARTNPERNARYWRLAMVAAGYISMRNR